MRWQAQEQAAAALTLQAQMMSGRSKASAEQPSQQDAPKRKPPIATMDDFIKSQERA